MQIITTLVAKYIHARTTVDLVYSEIKHAVVYKAILYMKEIRWYVMRGESIN